MLMNAPGQYWEQSTEVMWVLTNRAGSFYQLEPTRTEKIAEEFLKGYDGAVLTDGYGGYNRIKKALARV